MTTATKSRLTYAQSTVSSADGVLTFNLDVQFSPIEGDLPPGVTGVFVKQVGVPSDPKSDSFMRIATLADLGRVANTRELAVDAVKFRPAGGIYISSRESGPSFMYLAASLTLAFDNLQVAIQAKAVMEQRIDALLNDWKLFKDSYLPVTSVDFPLADSALVEAARQAMYTSISSYVTSLDTKKARDTAYADAMAVYTTKSEEVDRINGIKPYVCSSVSLLTSFDAAYESYFNATNSARSQVLTTLSGVKSFVTDDADFTDLRDAATTTSTNENNQYSLLNLVRVNNLTTASSNIQAACSLLDQQLLSASALKANAERNLAGAAASKATLQAEVDAKKAIVESKYASLMTLCPSYDSSKDATLPEMGEWRYLVMESLGG